MSYQIQTGQLREDERWGVLAASLVALGVLLFFTWGMGAAHGRESGYQLGILSGKLMIRKAIESNEPFRIGDQIYFIGDEGLLRKKHPELFKRESRQVRPTLR